jgi:diguanylate cyclase (GGDEF)-like protein
MPRLDTALAAFHPVDSKRVGNILLEALASHGKFEVAARLRRPDGDIRHVILRGETHGNEAGQVESLIGVMVDVTEPKRLESRLLPHAGQRDTPLEDNLTGLADRQQFDLSLNYEYKRAVRSKKPLGMVLLEIDHFAEYAAHYGMMGADACLRQVAHTVHALPRRTGDVVARFGRAEIAILLPLADAAGALRVANSVAEAVRALVLAHAAHDSGVVTISCGAASIGMDDLYNPQELSRRAARALAQAQVQGGNQAVAFEAERVLEIVRD